MHSSGSSSAVVRFGVFEADLRSGELRKNGAKVKIQELPFRALKFLLGRPNEVLSRDEFRQALWPDGVFVDFDRGISSAINRLRDALGDAADNPIFVETVERRGYRWIAPVHAIPTPAAEVVAEIPAPIPVPSPSPVSLRWKWILVLPGFALLFALWGFRSGSRAANASTRTQPLSAALVPGAHHPSNPEAEDLYLKGRFYWNKRTPDDLNKAVDYFTQAIVHDPGYAQPYVGLADSYNLLREYTTMPASEAYPRALAAAKKAVELDDQSSEAHASLAFISYYGMWDANAAEREFRRAIELNPNNSTARHWHATFLASVGRHPESVAEIERAQTLDPSSMSILADKGEILRDAGRHDEAMRLLKQLAATEPAFVSPHRYLKFGYFEAGDYANFVSEWKTEALLRKDGPAMELSAAAEKGLSAGGATGMFRNIRQVQKKYVDRGLLSPYELAQTCARLGNKSEAIQYLKIAEDRHDESLINASNDVTFLKMHDDPAYQDLIARLKPPGQN